jgi:MoxR-like ATPase
MPDEDGKLCFEEGKFLQSIRENSWLIIDEINRADIDKAFGQLFTVLSGQGVELPYKIDGMSVQIKRSNKNKSYYDQKTATYYVGKNWRILATMNVYDKDYLFEMSYAFMRRFTFIYIDLPETEEFQNLIRYWSKSLNEDQLVKIENLLEINEERQLGPAIFKDIVEYVEERHRIGSDKHVFEDAVLSFIMPQFEGLEKAQVQSIGQILKKTFEDTEELEKRIFEITTIKLDDKE